MTLIVGLGNPTNKYENTRHNIGFILIDLIKTLDFTKISSEKFKGDLFKFKDLLLLKPTTFMNFSGDSVKAVKDFYKPERIIIIHDDLDLSFGALRFKKGGGSGGHNGIKSIDNLIGSDYERVRIGIGRKVNVADFVLSEFDEKEKESLTEILQYTKTAILELINSDIVSVNQKFSRKQYKKTVQENKTKAINFKGFKV